MSVFLTLMSNGLANSALYFLMAAGLSLIFGLLRVINFAHGGFYVWGAYVGTFLYTYTHNFALAIAAGVVMGAGIGWFTEKLLVSRVYRDGTQQLLITMGVLMVLSELVKFPFGRDPVESTAPAGLTRSWLIGHFVVVEYQIFTLAVSVLVYVLLQTIIYRSKVGIIIRAGVSNPELVEARGIPIRRVFASVFTIGAALAGLAGALAGPYYGSISPQIGMDMQLNAFIIVVLGGLGSVTGSLVGSLVIGIATAVVGYYAPSLAMSVDVLLMAVVLVIRPHGLLGEKETVQ